MIEEEKLILKNLQYNEDFTRKVAPFLHRDYFSSETAKTYYDEINKFFEQYNTLPSKDAMIIQFQGTKVAQAVFDELITVAEEFDSKKHELVVEDWLLNKTEEFCKNKSLELALYESMQIAMGNNKNLSTTAIPDLLSKALGVSFDTSVGHDYLGDADFRFEQYHNKAAKIPFHLDTFNQATDGGVERQTVNCVAAPTGIGKSHLLCDLAANYIKMGYDVLYITMELAEWKVAQRIDANLMNVNMKDITDMAKPIWNDKISQLKRSVKNRLKIKEYPNGTAHIGHFKVLLRELKQKSNFVPTIVIIDYMNICASARIKARTDMYMYVKSIAEELRAFAQEFNIVLWTATQLNRDGIGNSDVDMKNISESLGGPMTFDFLFAMIATDELLALNQVTIKQFKSRYADSNHMNKFNIGIDRPKMKFYDLSNSSATSNSIPLGNRPTSGQKPTFGKPSTSKPVTGFKA